ncbi:DNA translocase FtsK [Patescibacteria group bacterium]|nr:DNA translocase FtsK [Patescibacteria group bacterium]
MRNKKKKYKEKRYKESASRRKGRFALPIEIKQMIFGVLLILIAIVICLSFFNLAGTAGRYLIAGLNFLIGNTVFIIPLILILSGLVFLNAKSNQEFLDKGKKVFWPVVLASLISIIGITGFLGSFNSGIKKGGWTGYLLSWPLLTYFGFWVAILVFVCLVIIGGLIFSHYLNRQKKEKEEILETASDEKEETLEEPKQSIIKSFFAPKFKMKEVPHFGSEPPQEEAEKIEEILKESKSVSNANFYAYQAPPLDLLEPERGAPMSGDTKVNASIIKKTFQNFNIDVTMSEVNIGPTVTQYTFKPAEGVKLSKITGLSNDLSLALAAHPIRIEAPIPGRALVGVEIPNKGRAQVRLRNLIENEAFNDPESNLNLALGRDVSGIPVYTDLTRMPHLLVAGATGTGKTIFLNTLILSLLYQSNTPTRCAGPETVRLVLVDPKRVEFPVFNNIPHLLCPILHTADQTIGALRWLTGEMERRFEVLAELKSRNIRSFNEKALKNGTTPLPFIVVVIDELADLMMAKGREIEGGIVRLAQMARAVGIHLVIATQRPSVEVITGLIKANITSRITFQVASQVDSRTIIDMGGAEKLLGYGDLLYISSYTPKPKRIQGSYISEKEVRRVIKYITDKAEREEKLDMDEELIQSIQRGCGEIAPSSHPGEYSDANSDPLFLDAKNIVIEANKASASLLQRRLRVGYARAARLIDMLEDQGIVGPADGAKPRDIFEDIPTPPPPPLEDPEDPDEEDQWKKL